MVEGTAYLAYLVVLWWGLRGTTYLVVLWWGLRGTTYCGGTVVGVEGGLHTWW